MSWVLMIQPIFKNALVVREGLIVNIMLWAEGKDMMCQESAETDSDGLQGRMDWIASG